MSFCNEALVTVIRQRLCVDYRIAAMSIDITSHDGCVSIHGCVDTPEQKKLIVNIVAGIIGVRQLSCENITVRPTKFPPA